MLSELPLQIRDRCLRVAVRLLLRRRPGCERGIQQLGNADRVDRVELGGAGVEVLRERGDPAGRGLELERVELARGRVHHALEPAALGDEDAVVDEEVERGLDIRGYFGLRLELLRQRGVGDDVRRGDRDGRRGARRCMPRAQPGHDRLRVGQQVDLAVEDAGVLRLRARARVAGRHRRRRRPAAHGRPPREHSRHCTVARGRLQLQQMMLRRRLGFTRVVVGRVGTARRRVTAHVPILRARARLLSARASGRRGAACRSELENRRGRASEARIHERAGRGMPYRSCPEAAVQRELRAKGTMPGMGRRRVVFWGSSSSVAAIWMAPADDRAACREAAASAGERSGDTPMPTPPQPGRRSGSGDGPASRVVSAGTRLDASG